VPVGLVERLYLPPGIVQGAREHLTAVVGRALVERAGEGLDGDRAGSVPFAHATHPVGHRHEADLPAGPLRVEA